MENLSLTLGEKIAANLDDILNLREVLAENLDLDTFSTLEKMDGVEIYKAKTLIGAIENKAKETNECLDKQLDILEGIAKAKVA